MTSKPEAGGVESVRPFDSIRVEEEISSAKTNIQYQAQFHA